ncbi:prevent-host-death protein [Umezawaea endophytica]|uniref:Prevent-host-death protein n=1 Tax=Umezawaea endophytica TaxID=1654476 RepID=A0A9X2VVV3_9PSEU|nr:prevent-host-death protein [Umezawaea endophytica]MCS7482648.1 prevent-host-death protein [Umezawaea endophytica]
MSKEITGHEPRSDRDAIVRAGAGGEVFVVTSDGGPSVPPGRRTFVPRAELARAAVRAPVIDSAAFRADLDAPFHR